MKKYIVSLFYINRPSCLLGYCIGSPSFSNTFLKDSFIKSRYTHVLKLYNPKYIYEYIYILNPSLGYTPYEVYTTKSPLITVIYNKKDNGEYI